MKKILSIALLLAVMAGAMAQQGTREYVSALITFADTNMIPQDSLNKYGVVLQTRSGRMATALIDASQYQSFLNANLVERVQPSTRVFLRDEQVNPMACEKHHDCCKDGRHNVRQNLIPEDDILNDEAKGWYVGLMLGGSRNMIDVQSARWSGTWIEGRGFNLDARTGYQFNQWFGIRSGLSLTSKNYRTRLKVNYLDLQNEYSTDYQNLYLQLPVLADLSVGGKDVRINFTFGGYCGYWLSQWRHGYVYVADDPRPFTGDAYSFVEGSDRRFEAGLAGGLGLTFRVTPTWQLHFEGTYYHGLLSTAKDYETYNRTVVYNMGLTYHF